MLSQGGLLEAAGIYRPNSGSSSPKSLIGKTNFQKTLLRPVKVFCFEWEVNWTQFEEDSPERDLYSPEKEGYAPARGSQDRENARARRD
jgi:hypothetical protein